MTAGVRREDSGEVGDGGENEKNYAMSHAALDLQTPFYANHDCFMEAAVEPLRPTFPDFVPHSETSTLQG